MQAPTHLGLLGSFSVLFCASLAAAQACDGPYGVMSSCQPCSAIVRGGCNTRTRVLFDATVTTFFLPNGTLDLTCSRATAHNSSTGQSVFESVGDCTCNTTSGLPSEFDKSCLENFTATLIDPDAVTSSTDLTTSPVEAAWQFPSTHSPCISPVVGDAAIDATCRLCPPGFEASAAAFTDSTTLNANYAMGYSYTHGTGNKSCPEAEPVDYTRVSAGAEQVGLAGGMRKCSSYAYNTGNGGGVVTVRVWLAGTWERPLAPCAVPDLPSELTTFVVHQRVRISLSDGSALHATASGSVTALANGTFVRTGIFTDSAFDPAFTYDGDPSELTGVTFSGVVDTVLDTGELPEGVYITSICESSEPVAQPVVLDVDGDSAVTACDRRALYALVGTSDALICASPENEFRQDFDLNDDGIIDAADVAAYLAQYNMLDACTRADYNCDGVTNPDDLGDYITDFYSSNPDDVQRAEFNDDGVVNPDDVGDFITVYYTCLP